MLIRNQTKERLITICFLIPEQVQFYLIYILHENGNSFESTESRKSSFLTKIFKSDGKTLSNISAEQKNILGEVLNEVLHD